MSLTHTHILTYAHTATHTHPHTHTHTHTHTLTHTYTHIHTYSQIHTHTHTHTHTYTHTHTHTHIYTHSQIHTATHNHPHTHTYTNWLSNKAKQHLMLSLRAKSRLSSASVSLRNSCTISLVWYLLKPEEAGGIGFISRCCAEAWLETSDNKIGQLIW